MHDIDSLDRQIERHSILITFFATPKALRKDVSCERLTLPELLARIRATEADAKHRLPLLKLATFGDIATPKGSMRSDANMQEAYGLEAEHDSGCISFRDAVRRLREYAVRALIYTTPSHVPGTQERWRVLIPLAKAIQPAQREQMVARLNSIFDGALAAESFVRSQSYYFGKVSGNDGFRARIIDGDLLDEIDASELPPPMWGSKPDHRSAPGGQPRVTATPAEAEETLRKAAGRDREGWHNAMLTMTAHLAASNLTEDAIAARLGVYCREGEDDPELWTMIESAVEKYGLKAPPEEVRQLLAGMATNGSNTVAMEENESNDSFDSIDSLDADALLRRRPDPSASLDDKRDWLLANYGWSMHEERVIDLHAADAGSARVGINAFREAFSDFFAGKVMATALWSRSPHRIHVAGVRMRPDRPFPLYSEDSESSEIYKNIYRKPRHGVAGSADVTPFLRFMDRFLPDGGEREWFLDWMAHKWLHPEVPGVACILVASDEDGAEDVRAGAYGTGRDTLFGVARALYGVGYVTPQEFKVLSGVSSQSAFTDWMHNAVLCTVNEAKESATAYRLGERSAVYEILKGIVDPAPQPRHFKVKYGPAFVATCYCSFWIATNHTDAMIIPPGDRRFAVLSNGRPMTPAEVRDIRGWISQRGSIAALAAFLEARDLSGFDAMQAPATAAKTTMAEQGRTLVEQAMLDLIADNSKGKVFTRPQLRATLEDDPELKHEIIHGHFDAAWRKMCVGLKTDLRPRRVRIDGTQRKVFCFRRHRKVATEMNDESIRQQVLTWSHCYKVGNDDEEG